MPVAEQAWETRVTKRIFVLSLCMRTGYNNVLVGLSPTYLESELLHIVTENTARIRHLGLL